MMIIHHISIFPCSLLPFQINSAKPFNAEPPDELLVEHFLTPNELYFKRNHLPVPDIKPENYSLEGEGRRRRRSMMYAPRFSISLAMLM